MNSKSDYMDGFYRWAKGFSGCDGGNLEKADTWLCGLEWGTSDSNIEEYYKKIKKQIKDGFVDPQVTNGKYIFKDQNTYKFGYSFSKLYAVINQKKIDSYKEYTESLTGNEVFKLNLYPIAFSNFKNEQWNLQGFNNILPMFKTKESYKIWCKLNRFPVFKNTLEKHSKKNLKRVICIGITSVNDFIDALYVSTINSKDLIVEKIITNKNKKQSDRRMYCARMENGIYFYVIPFATSASGLNSDDLLEETGKIIYEFENN